MWHLLTSELYKSAGLNGNPDLKEDDLYFLTDINAFYKGSKLFCPAIEFFNNLNGFPKNPATNRLYFNIDTTEGYVYNKDAWICIIKSLGEISKNNTDKAVSGASIVSYVKNEISTNILIPDGKTVIVSEENNISLKDFGLRYYAFRYKDNVLESGDYSYPDNMPSGVANSFIRINDRWYKYTNRWIEYDGVVHETDYHELVDGWKSGLEPKSIGDPISGYSIAWYEPSSTTVEGLRDIVTSLQTSVFALTSLLDNLNTSIQNNKTNITEEIKRAKASENILYNKIDDTDSVVQLLNADDSYKGSIKYQIKTAVDSINNLIGILPSIESINNVIEYIDYMNKESIKQSNKYSNDNFISKNNIITSENISESIQNSSKEKVISEEVLLKALSWKTSII